MTTKFSVRDARAADLRAICAIDQAAFSQPWQPQTFADALRDPKYFVLVAQSDFVQSDFVQSDFVPNDFASETDIPSESLVCGFGVAYTVGDEGEIATLAVDEAMRGAGVGETILRTLLARCEERGAAQIFLEVRQSNVRAQKIYARLNFEIIGRRANYYADGETALVMKCTLKANS